MTEKDIGKELKKIQKGLRWLDTMIHTDYQTGKASISKKQVGIVKALFNLFEKLSWQIPFNSYKELKFGDTKPIDLRGITAKCGDAVKVRSCKKEHGDKTYFGIYIGDVALSISHSIEKGVVTASHSFYNPAIFIPELNEIVYGVESYWSKIESEEELAKAITDDTIQNVWYVKALKKLSGEKDIDAPNS
jgi:hypothetical protein